MMVGPRIILCLHMFSLARSLEKLCYTYFQNEVNLGELKVLQWKDHLHKRHYVNSPNRRKYDSPSQHT